ncbi:hypothetical protein EV426DRAFT_684640, partial [Tirmania nivea]
LQSEHWLEKNKTGRGVRIQYFGRHIRHISRNDIPWSMGSHTADSAALAAPMREGASCVSLSLAPSNYEAEAALSNALSQLLPPLEPPPRIPIRSSLHQKGSNPRINLGPFSSKRSSNHGSPSYPPSTSVVAHAGHRTSWLSGTTSSVSLPHGQLHAEAPSLAGSSRISLSTAGGSSGGAGSIPIAPNSPRRKAAVSDPFMFPLVAAPSPTHSVSVLSPALLEVPFSPGRAAPSPLSAVQRTHGDNVREIRGSEGGSTTTVHAIRAPRGMVENVREPTPPSVRSHKLWPASWGLSRVQKIFQSRQKGKAPSLALAPNSPSSFSRHSTSSVVSAQPMGQRQASLIPSSPPRTPSRTLRARRSLRNVRGIFGATAISSPLPQTSALFYPELGDNSLVNFSPPITATRPRDENDGCNNRMLSAVGELGEDTQGGGLEAGLETGKKISATTNRSNHKGKGMGNLKRVSREAAVSSSAVPASHNQDSSIRQNSVIGYIYPCKYCTRNWLEECSCLTARGIAATPASQKDLGPATSTRSPPQGAHPPSPAPRHPPSPAPPPHNSPIPGRRNSRNAERLDSGGPVDASQVEISQPLPRLPPAPLPQSSYASVSQTRPIFSSWGNRHGRRGGSDELAKQGRGKFSWSNISLPISTARSVSSSSAPGGALVPPPTNSKRILPPVNVHSAQPFPTLPSPPSSPSAQSFVLSPAARDVLGIPSSTIVARRTRTPSGQYRGGHQRQSSTASGSSSASQPGASLRLWSSRPSSGSDAQGMVVVPGEALGSGRGRVSLRSVASATGVGVGAGEVERTGEEMMDPVRERDRMRRGLVALGLLNEGVEAEVGVEGEGEGGARAEGARRGDSERVVKGRGSCRGVGRQGSSRRGLG